MLGKIVLWLVLVGVGLLMLRRLLGPSKSGPSNSNPSTSNTGAPASQGQAPSTRLRACEVCGAHLPEDDAVLRGGKAYCSIEHAQKHTEKHTGKHTGKHTHGD